MASLRAFLLLGLFACARGTLPGPDDQPVPDPRDAGHAASRPDGGGHDAATAPPPVDASAPPERDASPPPVRDAAAGDAGRPGADDAGPRPVDPTIVVGGSGGSAFDDSDMLPASPEVKSVTIATADHLDRIELVLRSGSVFRHGGPTGNVQTLELAEGEAITSARLCTGAVQSGTRVFFVRLTSTQNRVLTGGTSTATCTDFEAPAGHQISGFHGRAGDVVDALGFLYTPLVAP